MSNGLKATLDNLKREALKDCDFTPYTIEELDIKIHREEVNKKIIEDCKILEKSLKALEIIKEKKVNVQELFDFIKEYGKHNELYMYNGHRPYEKRINEEEYDLLKEVLK